MTEFIDLGLPSGNLWATENTPNGSNYSWASMKANGYVESGRCDGQIPTKKDFEELMSFCNAVYNDKLDGMVLTSKNNDRCILLPCAWDKLGCEGYITKDGRDFDNGLLRLVKYKESATPPKKIDDPDHAKANELARQLFADGLREWNSITQRKRIEQALMEMAVWKDRTWKTACDEMIHEASERMYELGMRHALEKQSVLD